jgi:hypothetical protein
MPASIRVISSSAAIAKPSVSRSRFTTDSALVTPAASRAAISRRTSAASRAGRRSIQLSGVGFLVGGFWAAWEASLELGDAGADFADARARGTRNSGLMSRAPGMAALMSSSVSNGP